MNEWIVNASCAWDLLHKEYENATGERKEAFGIAIDIIKKQEILHAIILPCGIGQIVYEIFEEEHESCIGKCKTCNTDCSSYDICWSNSYTWEIKIIVTDEKYMIENYKKFGKTIFTDFDEAVKACKERQKR